MDTVTHALIGVVAASSCSKLNRQKSQHDGLLFIAGLSAAFPDIDYLWFWADPYRFITEWHRGLSHSLILLPAWAALLSTIAFFVMKKQLPFIIIFKYSSLGLLTHIVFDLITLYGLQAFAPLSNQRFALSLTFDIDPWIGLLALVGMVFGLKNRTNAIFGLLAIGIYIGLMFYSHQYALAIIDSRTKTGEMPNVKVYALPQPFIPFHWKLVIDRNDYYETADLSLLAQATELLDGLLTRQSLSISLFSAYPHHENDYPYLTKPRSHIPEIGIGSFRSVSYLDWQKISKYGDDQQEIEQALEVWQHDSFSRFRYFSTIPILYRIDTDSDISCIWYTDMRYVMPFIKPSFRYGMCREQSSNIWQLYRLRLNTENIRQRLRS